MRAVLAAEDEARTTYRFVAASEEAPAVRGAVLMSLLSGWSRANARRHGSAAGVAHVPAGVEIHH